MPSRKLRTPDAHVPTAAELVALVKRSPGASLRELCAALWPDLAWAGGNGADSATARTRIWPGPGGRAQEATAAVWLREQLAALVEAGELAHAPRRRDEVDLLAALAYVVPGAALPGPGPDALAAVALGRREVRHG